MTKKERIKKINQILTSLYPHPKPFLDHKNAFTLLIAVLLSAQSRDALVNQITPLLFVKANTPEKMVELSIEDIRKIIKPIGLSPTKAKAIWNLSKMLIDKFHGKVPHTFEELEELPGVGHKTASVVMSQWFNIPSFPVDTHIHRLAKRWKLSNGKNVQQTEKDLKALLPKSEWTPFHIRMIAFGREHCPALRHKFETCPICSWIH